MARRLAVGLLAAAFLSTQLLSAPAIAENKMGYSLLPASQAAQLPHGGGVLGMNVGRAQQITDSGMSFELLRVNGVRPGSAGERAGFRIGDQIIAVDGRVFPSVPAFAAYVGSKQPRDQISIDYLPYGGGPQQAQRVGVTLGGGNPAANAQPAPTTSGGLSTGAKVAIGVGAVALFGCYKLGCFSHRGTPAASPQTPRPVQQQ